MGFSLLTLLKQFVLRAKAGAQELKNDQSKHSSSSTIWLHWAQGIRAQHPSSGRKDTGLSQGLAALNSLLRGRRPAEVSAEYIFQNNHFKSAWRADQGKKKSMPLYQVTLPELGQLLIPSLDLENYGGKAKEWGIVQLQHYIHFIPYWPLHRFIPIRKTY